MSSPSTAPPNTKSPGVTDEIAAFVVSAQPGAIPKDVAHLAKRSVLDGIGLALAGAGARMRRNRATVFEGRVSLLEGGRARHREPRCACTRASTLSPTASRFTRRLHATQLAVAKDGLWPAHDPRRPARRPCCARERDRRSGAALMPPTRGRGSGCKVAQPSCRAISGTF